MHVTAIKLVLYDSAVAKSHPILVLELESGIEGLSHGSLKAG